MFDRISSSFENGIPLICISDMCFGSLYDLYSNSLFLKIELLKDLNIAEMDTQRQFELCLRTMKLALIRSERYCEGSINQAQRMVKDLLIKHFGNKKSLEHTGLKNAYSALANDITISGINIIGSILPDDELKSYEIVKYQTHTGNVINLTNTSILDELLNYLDKELIIKLCKADPRYVMYYKYCIDHRK